MVTLKVIHQEILPRYFSPVPPEKKLRLMLRNAGIAAVKTNPHAKAGGGPAFYKRSAVERWLSLFT
jgi:hypothetical protein